MPFRFSVVNPQTIPIVHSALKTGRGKDSATCAAGPMKINGKLFYSYFIRTTVFLFFLNEILTLVIFQPEVVLFFCFITCRAKLLNADWLRQRAFFLNQEGTFSNQEGMITWCWLAEQACIKLVSRFKRIFKGNFRNASLLSLILTRSFHLNVKENQHPTKRSLLVEKQKDFSDQKRTDS